MKNTQNNIYKIYDLLYFDFQCKSRIFQELSPLHSMEE